MARGAGGSRIVEEEEEGPEYAQSGAGRMWEQSLSKGKRLVLEPRNSQFLAANGKKLKAIV